MKKCKVCGKPLRLKASRRYEVMKLPVGLGCLIEHAHVFECFDCEYCGYQNIVNERETGRVKNLEDVEEIEE